MSDILEIDNLAPCMRAPMWRWTVALDHMASPHLISHKLYTDPYLSEAVRFLRARSDVLRHPTSYRRRYPAMYEANLINMCNLPHSFKWHLEALIIGGASDKYINDIYEFRAGEDTVDMYRHMFFDVTDQLKSPEVVLGNVLSTSYVNTDGKNDYDFLWKSFAYNFKADAVRTVIQQQGILTNMPKRHLNWFEEAKRNRLSYQSFAATINYRNIYLEQSMQVWAHAATNFQLSSAPQSSMEEGTQKSLVMKSLNEFIQKSLSNPSLQFRQGQVEERLALSYEDIADSNIA